MYAKPVTLTYNQQRTFTTVPGAILTILSAIFLSYYFSINVAEYISFQKYTSVAQKTTFTDDNQQQQLFDIPASRMQILTNITSDKPEILSEIDRYVGGVFIENTIN